MKRKRNSKATIAVMTDVTEANAAGIDVGSTEMYVAVPPDRDSQNVRRFATFTSELVRLADWLKQCGITSVAMESTSVRLAETKVFVVLERHAHEHVSFALATDDRVRLPSKVSFQPCR